MANSPAHESDRTLAQARQSLNDQRAGGRRVGSIGRQSAALKRGHVLRKLGRIGMAIIAIWVAASIAGLVIGGIGWTGIILTVLATFIAFAVFARFPKMTTPSKASLSGGDVKSLVGRTEMWLEGQRRALPPPAVKLVDHIGLQLDALGMQLKDVDPAHPSLVEVRKLVGEHLPGVVDGFRKIPEHLRYEERAGTNPNTQFMESLGLISTEIDSVTRQLASGAIDDLAIKTRYLDYKYGSALDEAGKP